jgi:hypothetical protein
MITDSDASSRLLRLFRCRRRHPIGHAPSCVHCSALMDHPDRAIAALHDQLRSLQLDRVPAWATPESDEDLQLTHLQYALATIDHAVTEDQFLIISLVCASAIWDGEQLTIIWKRPFDLLARRPLETVRTDAADQWLNDSCLSVAPDRKRNARAQEDEVP